MGGLLENRFETGEFLRSTAQCYGVDNVIVTLDERNGFDGSGLSGLVVQLGANDFGVGLVEQEMGALQGFSRGKRTVGGEREIHQGIQRGGGDGSGSILLRSHVDGGDGELRPGGGIGSGMGLGDDEAEIVEDLSEALPGGWDRDTECDGDGTLGAERDRSLMGGGLGRGGVPARRLGRRHAEAGEENNGGDGSLHGRAYLRSAAGAASGSPSARRASRGR